MNYQPASLYHCPPENAATYLIERLAEGLGKRPTEEPATVFFRADDIGVVSAAFARLLNLFGGHRMPLCLAVVPAWLTAARWLQINRLCRPLDSLWCWHQHGWTHRNHQRTGKKSEFGPDRDKAAIRRELLQGRRRLEELLGPGFTPVFTPPWNRCSEETMTILGETGYRAVSRDRNAPPPPPGSPPELPVNVDLHTRREQRPEICLSQLGAELELAASQGSIGLMIHHQRMNDHAFTVLDHLLAAISETAALAPAHFGRLL